MVVEVVLVLGRSLDFQVVGLEILVCFQFSRML